MITNLRIEDVSAGSLLYPMELDELKNSIDGELFVPLSPSKHIMNNVTILTSKKWIVIFVTHESKVKYACKDGKIIDIHLYMCIYITRNE